MAFADQIPAGPSPQGTLETGFGLQYSMDLSGTIYQDDTLIATGNGTYLLS